MQCIFTAHKHPLCSAYSSLSQLQSLEITAVFTVSIVLPFLECHVVEIQYTYNLFILAFFHLVIGRQASSMPFHDLIVHLFLVLDNSTLCEVPQFVYPFTH